MKDIYVVFSVMDSCSGSLTFPEDFSFEGFYEKESDAQDHVERENTKNGVVDFGERVFEEMVFTYEKLSNLKKKKK